MCFPNLCSFELNWSGLTGVSGKSLSKTNSWKVTSTAAEFLPNISNVGKSDTSKKWPKVTHGAGLDIRSKTVDFYFD